MTDIIETDVTLEPVCSHGKTAGNCVKCKDAKRKREERHKRSQQKNAATQATEQLWWEGNRTLLTPEALADLIAKDKYVRDLLFSMESIVDAALDPELLYIVRGFVETNGASHLGPITKNSIPYDWCSRKYWAEPNLLKKLTSENEQTETFILYGLHSALVDWKVVEFLTKKAGMSWKDAAALVGYRALVRDGVSVTGYPAD
jgi:hypothetical protein